MKITVLHDAVFDTGRPDERDTLEQAEWVAQLLQESGHQVALLSMGHNLDATAGALVGMQADLVFNLVESIAGKGEMVHLAPALLASLGLRHTGASTAAMLLTSQKLIAKQMLRGQGLRTPDWFSEATPADGLAPSTRYIVKSVWEDASLGLDDQSVLEFSSSASLNSTLAARATRLGGAAFAEAYVEGREFNLSLLEEAGGDVEVLPAAEISFQDYPPEKPHIVGYAAKWDTESFEYVHTPRRFDFSATDQHLISHLGGLARACWRLFGLAGYARVDFRVDQRGKPWILEINANPCLSPNAGLMAAAARAGLRPRDVTERIVEAAFPSVCRQHE